MGWLLLPKPYRTTHAEQHQKSTIGVDGSIHIPRIGTTSVEADLRLYCSATCGQTNVAICEPSFSQMIAGMFTTPGVVGLN